ncbi:hypothetical protein GOV14_04575 [Candidatus Pacearchaeota archaeon]|nr:hypothetical protein [Candidatus Pacearchaeota archaeon]
MKHSIKVTTILVIMFFVTQLIGLFVIATYNSNDNQLPFGMEPPEELKSEDSLSIITSIVISFIIAVALFVFLTKINAAKFIRFWFFFVTILALSLAINALLVRFNLVYPAIIAAVVALPFAFIKIYRRNFYVHNFTELLIYPGIAAVFVPILGIFGIIILLLIISLYDIWAVWRSGFMQKMANYQMNNLKIFAGFFVPYANKGEKAKIQQIKQKYKGKGDEKIEKEFKKAKVKVSLAILGGGDVVFPIITAGVFYKLAGLMPALVISVFATLSLIALFILARKGKFYPAMPFLTTGMYLGMLVNWLIL